MKFNDDDCGWIIEDDDLKAGRVYKYEGFGDVRMPEDALVVLLAADVLVPLNGDGGICLEVMCSDTFAYACADSESVPPIGFGEEHDKPFWDLWSRWVADHTWGPVQWVVLRRNQRPITPVVERMLNAGAWPTEMEAIPVCSRFTTGDAVNLDFLGKGHSLGKIKEVEPNGSLTIVMDHDDDDQDGYLFERGKDDYWYEVNNCSDPVIIEKVEQ